MDSLALRRIAMESQAAAWQLDFFAEATPILAAHAVKPDPLPNPHMWSAAIKDQMVDALIALACDSRRGDSMPESLMDCADLLSQRLRGVEVDREDYRATLGWIMGYWGGALPYSYVCRVNGVDPETLQDVVLSNGLLKGDLELIKSEVFGSLI
jgi:sulfur relay (sulfurtransferase) complex TusBCD TusD component (DsrE family)